MRWEASQHKAELRARIRLQRRTRDWSREGDGAAGVADRLAGLLPDRDSASAITAYLPYPTEPDPTGAFPIAVARGLAVLLPRVTGPGAMAWVQWHEQAVTSPGALGVPEPQGESVADDAPSLLAQRPGLLVIPALAVDLAGVRLGQGGGYFDRLLRHIPPRRIGGPLRAVVVFDEEVLETAEIPHQEHDERVDVIVTPTRAIEAVAGGPTE